LSSSEAFETIERGANVAAPEFITGAAANCTKLGLQYDNTRFQCVHAACACADAVPETVMLPVIVSAAVTVSAATGVLLPRSALRVVVAAMLVCQSAVLIYRAVSSSTAAAAPLMRIVSVALLLDAAGLRSPCASPLSTAALFWLTLPAAAYMFAIAFVTSLLVRRYCAHRHHSALSGGEAVSNALLNGGNPLKSHAVPLDDDATVVDAIDKKKVDAVLTSNGGPLFRAFTVPATVSGAVAVFGAPHSCAIGVSGEHDRLPPVMSASSYSTPPLQGATSFPTRLPLTYRDAPLLLPLVSPGVVPTMAAMLPLVSLDVAPTTTATLPLVSPDVAPMTAATVPLATVTTMDASDTPSLFVPPHLLQGDATPEGNGELGESSAVDVTDGGLTARAFENNDVQALENKASLNANESGSDSDEAASYDRYLAAALQLSMAPTSSALAPAPVTTRTSRPPGARSRLVIGDGSLASQIVVSSASAVSSSSSSSGQLRKPRPFTRSSLSCTLHRLPHPRRVVKRTLNRTRVSPPPPPPLPPPLPLPPAIPPTSLPLLPVLPLSLSQPWLPLLSSKAPPATMTVVCAPSPATAVLSPLPMPAPNLSTGLSARSASVTSINHGR
jgi:hypothetical protein